MALKLNNQQQEWFVQTLRDPAAWAEAFLKDPMDPQQPLTLRSYQREILENTRDYNNMVLRYGRRMGKCSKFSDIIHLHDGVKITVEELWNRYNLGEELRLMNLNEDMSITASKPIIMQDNGFKETFEVKTKSGRKINVTENHPLLRIDGWQSVADLKPGDRILVPSKIDYNTTQTIDSRIIKFLAYLLGDGSIIRGIRFTNRDLDVINDFKESCKFFGDVSFNEIYRNNCYDISMVMRKQHSNFGIDYLREHGLFGKNSHTKFIPNVIFTLRKDQQALFLSRLFACDGWASVSKSNRKSGNCEIGYCSVSEDLVYGVSDLLVRFGVKHFVTERDIKYKGCFKRAFQISIRNKEDIISFIRNIGIFSKEEACNNVLEYVYKRSNIQSGYFYQVPKEVIELYNIKNPRKYGIRKKYNVSKIKLLLAARDQGISHLIDICESNTYFDEIVSIKDTGKNQTYAIEVPDTHNYIVGNIITHNTVAFCADALWWTAAQPLAEMFESGGTKQKPFKVLILTPMDSQIKMIFDTLLALCADSPFIQDMVKKIRRSDVSEIQFTNGSIIKGMTIGISSANKGLTARGQSADYLFLDEADYIPREVMEQAIFPIWSTKQGCKMRVCSTPSGKRELYYEWCTKSEELGWWHRHYPSWHKDNPSWISIKECEESGRPIHESTEYQYRSVTDNNSYLREYGAEFGEELHGVYKHELINKSLVNYCPNYIGSDTSVFNPGFDQVPGNIYIIGVDWNSYVNGGQVVMLEYCVEPTAVNYYDPEEGEVTINFTNKFRLFYRKGIKSEEGTQRGTREEIIRLLRNYKVDHLYVDYGYGDTNIEELTFYGKENPHLGIQRKLHVIDSGSNIEHYDPLLQKKIKKRAKSLMINTSVVSLEEGRMLLPKEEDNKQRLIDQMRNYVVKSVTVKGDYTYDGEDHILDAFNLAVYGFYHQYSVLLKTRYENKIKFMYNPRLADAPKRQQKAESVMTKNQPAMRDPEKPPQFNVPRHITGIKYSRASNNFGSGFRKQL